MSGAAFIKSNLYALKRDYGLPIDIYQKTGTTVNLITGATSSTENIIRLKKAIVLPLNLQTRGLLPRRGDFAYGGFLDLETKIFIILKKDAPDLSLGSEDHIVSNHQRYNVQEFSEYDHKQAYLVIGKLLKNVQARVIVPKRIQDRIKLRESFAYLIGPKEKEVPSDQLDVADSILYRMIRNRSVSDTLSLTDLIVQANSGIQRVDDTIVLLEQALFKAQRSRSVADTLALTDLIADIHQRMGVGSDNMLMTDQALFTMIRPRSASESVSLTDQILFNMIRRLAVTDTLSLTDQVQYFLNGVQQQSDSLSLTDVLAYLAIYVRSLSDTLSLTDSRLFNAVRPSPESESINFTDSVAFNATRPRDASDSANLTDSIIQTAVRPRIIADTLSLTDNPVALRTVPSIITDTLSLTDTRSLNTILGKIASENMSLTDSIVSKMLYPRSVSESLSVADDIAYEKTVVQSSLLTNLISYWTLDESSGTRNDSHSTIHLTDAGSLGSTTGIIGSAANFGISDRLSHTSNTSLQTGDIDFTFAIWLYRTVTGQYYSYLKKYSTGSNYEFWFLHDSVTAQYQWAVNGAGIVNASNFGTAPTGSWNLVIMWHDSVNNEVGIQVNNGTPNTTSYSGGVTVGSGDFRLGDSADLFANPGRYDEFAFWKCVLTSTQRGNLWNSGAGVTYPFTGVP